jgi:hypothetical protein
MRYLFILPILLIIASCTNNNQKQASTGPTSIYKIWQYKTIDTTISRKKTNNSSWIGNNKLDLTNKDTLKFSYGSIHNRPTAYLYKIQHDTIFIQNKPGYKILKLTADELHLLVAFKNTGKDSTVVIYQAKE